MSGEYAQTKCKWNATVWTSNSDDKDLHVQIEYTRKLNGCMNVEIPGEGVLIRRTYAPEYL